MKKIETIHCDMKPKAAGLYPRNIGPFTGVEYDIRVTFSPKKVFRIATYQAYNAMGLIGSESNGIVVLNEGSKSVVCDEIMKESSGYFGASEKQFRGVMDLVGMTYANFRKVINAQPRLRYKL